MSLPSLRDQCVEAAAKSGYAGDAWDYVDAPQRRFWLVDAQLAFDAILDTLEAQAAQWQSVALHTPLLDLNVAPQVDNVSRTALCFIAALRDSVGVEVEKVT